MKYLTLACAFATLFIPLHAADSQSATTQKKPTESRRHGADKNRIDPEPRIKACLEKFSADRVRSLLENRPELMVEYYAEGVRLMPEYQKTVLGKTNASFYHKAFLNRFRVEGYSREQKEVTDLGSRVVEVGVFSMKLVLKSTGHTHQLTGKYLDLWAKLENDKLSLITEAWNYDQQLEIAQDLKFAEVPAVQMAFQAHLPVKGNICFELAALNRLLEIAISQHDADLWSQFYADDAIVIANFTPICQGRKAVDDYIENHVKHLPVFEKLDIRNDQIDQLGDYIIEYATHITNWRNGESSGVSTGKNIRIWRREPDGFLKIFLQIGMYD